MDCLSLYKFGIEHLTAHNITDPELESALLLAEILHVSRSSILLNLPVCDTATISRFKSYIKQRCQHVPFAYIVGTQEFWSLDFNVTPDVLIPRPETELIIEHVETLLDSQTFTGTILDCGTGSGVLPITLATLFAQAHFMALDLSAKALQVAKQNSIRHGVHGRVSLLQADFMQALPFAAQFDVIVANPPYVDSATFSSLQDEVIYHEPHLALDGKGDGFDIVAHLLAILPQYLVPSGHLFMEIGFDQQQRVVDLLRSLPIYGQYTVINDLAGLPRMVHAVKVK